MPACGDSSPGSGTVAPSDAGEAGQVSNALPAAFLVCGRATDCTLTGSSCCCGSSVGIAASHVAEYRASLCTPAAQMKCGAEDCAGPGDTLVADCREGKCKAVDLTTDDLTSTCSADRDCEARQGLACCASCDSYPTTAVVASKVTACDPTFLCARCLGAGKPVPFCAPADRCVMRGSGTVDLPVKGTSFVVKYRDVTVGCGSSGADHTMATLELIAWAGTVPTDDAALLAYDTSQVTFWTIDVTRGQSPAIDALIFGSGDKAAAMREGTVRRAHVRSEVAGVLAGQVTAQMVGVQVNATKIR